MAGVKAWQIVLVVVALLATGGSVFYSCSTMGSQVKQASDTHLVDIQTGELFVASYPKRPVFFPAKNPGTGEPTLYPVFFRDNKWVLNTRYMSDVKANKSLKADLIVNAKSGEIKAISDKPKRVDVFGT